MAPRDVFTTHGATPIHRDQPAAHQLHSLITRTHLGQLLGCIWLADGLFQMQPVMVTTNLVTNIMQPVARDNPAPSPPA